MIEERRIEREGERKDRERKGEKGNQSRTHTYIYISPPHHHHHHTLTGFLKKTMQSPPTLKPLPST